MRARLTGTGGPPASGKEKGKSDELCSVRPAVSVCVYQQKSPPLRESGHRRWPLLLLLPSFHTRIYYDNGTGSREQHRSRSVAATGRPAAATRPLHSTILLLLAAGLEPRPAAVLASCTRRCRAERAFSPGGLVRRCSPCRRQECCVVWCGVIHATQPIPALFLAGALCSCRRHDYGFSL